MKTLKVSRTKLISTVWVIGLLIMFFIHLFLICSYFSHEKKQILSMMPSKRNYSLIFSVIDASRFLPKNKLAYLSDFNHYSIMHSGSQISLSVTEKPIWTRHVKTTVSDVYLLKLIKNMGFNVSFSYQLKNNLWLNYSEKNKDRPWNVMILMFILEVIIIMIVVAYLYSINRLKEPLENITTSANRLGIDINYAPIPTYGSSIVRSSINAMNKMQERIQELIHHRTRLLAAISHDLRTPITRLKLRTQYIEDETLFNKFNADLDEMQTMIKETLSYSKNDMLHEKKIVLNVNSLLQSICDDFEEIGSPVKFNNHGVEIYHLGRPLALKRAFSNIINNGLNYASNVEVDLDINAFEIIIEILDDGPGIAEDEIAEVVKPFYRSKNVKSKKSTGVGLGLSIAQEIILDHAGKLSLSNAVGGGLKVTIVLQRQSRKED